MSISKINLKIANAKTFVNQEFSLNAVKSSKKNNKPPRYYVHQRPTKLLLNQLDQKLIGNNF